MTLHFVIREYHQSFTFWHFCVQNQILWFFNIVRGATLPSGEQFFSFGDTCAIPMAHLLSARTKLPPFRLCFIFVFFLFVCVLCHVASFFFNRLRWMSGKKHGSRHNFSYIELIERASKLFSPSQCMLWGRIQPSLIHNGEKKNSTQKIMRGCTLCEGT